MYDNTQPNGDFLVLSLLLYSSLAYGGLDMISQAFSAFHTKICREARAFSSLGLVQQYFGFFT